MGFEIELPESKKTFEVRSMTRTQVRENEAMVRGLFTGALAATAYQDQILGMVYPDLDMQELEAWPGSDVAHLVRVTVDYSIGGPSAVKNWSRSGSGTATG